jgi:hypothetical protein
MSVKMLLIADLGSLLPRFPHVKEKGGTKAFPHNVLDKGTVPDGIWTIYENGLKMNPMDPIQ